MKKKIVKKFIAAALAAAVTVSMAGCGDSGKPAANNSQPSGSSEPVQTQQQGTEEEEPGAYTVLKDENGNVYDLGGMEVIIRDWWTADEEKEPSNAFEEAQQEYFDWMQETYNFTVKQVAVSSWASTPEDFVNYATTGGDENYIFVLRQGSELLSAMNSGLMYDLATIDCLDFSKLKWRSGVHEMFTKGDSTYAMRGIDPEPKGGMFFNKRLLEEAGINPQDIYDMQENMEWTWEKFEEICKQVQADTDNDGVTDRYALVCVNQDFFPQAVWSNGGEYIGKDASGKYYSALESDETIEALNWSVDMIDKYAKVFAEDANWDYAYTAFANGEGVFIPQEAYKAGDWKDMEDDFGFVCFPRGPKADDYTNCYMDNVYAIPACYDADKAWKLAFVYNLYTEPIPGYEDDDSWKAGYYQNFRDTESVDFTLDRLINNGMVTYHTFVPGLDMGPDVYWEINKDNTPAQQAEAIRNTWAAYLEEANK